MNRWHNYYIDNNAHFLTATVTDWRPLLRDEAVHVLYDEWSIARQALNVRVLAYCIMPEHYHAILWAEIGDNIRKYIHRTHAQTSRQLQPGGGLWKERPHVLPIYNKDILQTKLDYLHRNPVRRELVINPEEWEHSSFRQLILRHSNVVFVCDDWDGMLIR